jgi:Holliday junction resolvase RusA-like endonuclease
MTQRDKRPPKRPCVARYHDFKDALMGIALEQGYRPGLMDVYRIDAVVHLPMPASWSKKKQRAHHTQPHRQRPDADNILKAICDSLLEDDSRVWDKRIQKYWAVFGCVDLQVWYTEIGSSHAFRS